MGEGIIDHIVGLALEKQSDIIIAQRPERITLRGSHGSIEYVRADLYGALEDELFTVRAAGESQKDGS